MNPEIPKTSGITLDEAINALGLLKADDFSAEKITETISSYQELLKGLSASNGSIEIQAILLSALQNLNDNQSTIKAIKSGLTLKGDILSILGIKQLINKLVASSSNPKSVTIPQVSSFAQAVAGILNKKE